MAERAATTYEAIRTGAAWRAVPRDGVLVTGPGALDWLQGQVSQDLAQLSPADSATGTPSIDTLVLSPQGKIESACRVTSLGLDRYLLDVRSGFGDALFDRLRRFKLRVKADLERLEPLGVLEVRGPASPSVAELGRLAGVGAGAGAGGVGSLAEVLAVVDVDWDGWTGRDVIFVDAAANSRPWPLARSIASSLGLDSAFAGAEPAAGERVGALAAGDGSEAGDAFEAARIEAGVPELGSELNERTIPQEAGELVARAVSFTKGCYTGQELVARIDARGSNTPRRLQGVVIDASPGSPSRPDSTPAPGDELLLEGSRVGELTSVAWSPGFAAFVALAYVKRGTAVPSEAVVALRAGTAPAAIRVLPLVSG
ncbi:MAG: glycine cleavage T C-terminal barrel domain-containing protein [Acidimicrobiales bacterium]